MLLLSLLIRSLIRANRAAWRWAQERARLASRWNWLTAEISDLDYRIRQHTDLHQQLRKNKGPVLLLPPTATSSPTGAEDKATEATGAAPTGSPTPGNVNGYRGLLPGQYSSGKAMDGVDGFMADVENELEGTASRTRPYQRTVFKKRKLVQTVSGIIYCLKCLRNRNCSNAVDFVFFCCLFFR